jgi:hypothetical protein
MGPKSKGKVTKGKNFTASELNAMLTLVEEFLPLGSDHWENVAFEYNKKVSSDRVRNADSLRKKFKVLRNVKKPTGDPDCPIEVKRAKRAQYAIEAKMGVENFDSDNNNDANSNDDNDSDTEAPYNFGGDNNTEYDAFGEGNQDNVDGDVVEFNDADAEDTPQPPARGRPPRPPPQSAAANRVGYTTAELAAMSRSRSNTPSPTGSSMTSSASTAAKRSIDTMLYDMSSAASSSSSQDGYMSYLTNIMMWQRQEDAKRDERENERREEREAIRREEARCAEERQDRREEAAAKREAAHMQMMMAFIASMKEK